MIEQLFLKHDIKMNFFSRSAYRTLYVLCEQILPATDDLASSDRECFRMHGGPRGGQSCLLWLDLPVSDRCEIKTCLAHPYMSRLRLEA